MTGEEGKEVIAEIEKNLSRLYTVLKVCVPFLMTSHCLSLNPLD
jgi:hypothetical protein